jgi:hypothetical protein
MFGNYHIDGLRLSTLDEVKEHYPQILNELILEKEYKDEVKVYNVYDEDSLLLCGTIKDVIQWAKDQWKYNDVPNGNIKDVLNVEIEEDYYYQVDNSPLTILHTLGYDVVVACTVPLEDFE